MGDALNDVRILYQAKAHRLAAALLQFFLGRRLGSVIGHGGGSFGFDTTRRMLAAGFRPDAISSDIHSLSIDGPAFDLLVTMSKFLSLGQPLMEVVRAATVAPADAVRRPDLGRLQEGAVGDVSVIEDRPGWYRYADVLGETILGEHKLLPRAIVLDGKLWHEAD